MAAEALPVVATDGCHLKTGDGQCLLLIGRDGNKKSIILAIGIVPTENASNYAYFFQHLRSAGLDRFLDGGDVVMFSDRSAPCWK